MPQEIRKILGEIKDKFKVATGIHCHNDLDLAVANSLAAVEMGCTQIQGTFNGLGERCGNVHGEEDRGNLTEHGESVPRKEVASDEWRAMAKAPG